MPTPLDENNTCIVQDKEMGRGAMPTLLDENNTCTVQGNGGGELCLHASTRITPVQYKEMVGGGYAHTPRRE